MPIKPKDYEFMKTVSRYYRETVSAECPDGSIRDTAIYFNLNRNKIRKILITTGDITNPITEDAMKLRQSGVKIVEIAERLGVSTATVSTALPYDGKYDNSLEPTEHATKVREYRAYEKKRKEIQVRNMSQNTGKQNNRAVKSQNPEKKYKMPKTVKSIRLHLELYSDYPDKNTTRLLKKYGGICYGNSISRDLIVPADIPLYALHYAIQKSFGWQNSHLRQFELPEARYKSITNDNAAMWNCLVGVIFRSPLMEDGDEFWADDYIGGSFKKWLRGKYTGPYQSLCRGESYLVCRDNMREVDMEEECYLLYQNQYNPKKGDYSGDEVLSMAMPMYGLGGHKLEKPKPWHDKDIPHRVESVRFRDFPVDGVRFLYDRYPLALLECLPVGMILAVGKNAVLSKRTKSEKRHLEEEILHNGAEVLLRAEELNQRNIREFRGIPRAVDVPIPVTDEILYNYDFGDNWKVRITAGENCDDLISDGRVTPSEIDAAYEKCQKEYRPVMIARDGEMLIDDVGGIHGFAEFLRCINPDLERMTDSEKTEALIEKRENLEWAKGMGWHRDDAKDVNLL